MTTLEQLLEKVPENTYFELRTALKQKVINGRSKDFNAGWEAIIKRIVALGNWSRLNPI